nr:MAG TPA: hypothetical protein [Caudoviricetes sp.]
MKPRCNKTKTLTYLTHSPRRPASRTPRGRRIGAHTR